MASRTLTMVAKCLQNLANLNEFGAKVYLGLRFILRLMLWDSFQYVLTIHIFTNMVVKLFKFK